MNHAVLIFAWKRPDYLKVCLDSLVASGCDIPVVVSYDGPEQELVHPVITYAIRHDDHVGNLWHVVRSIETAFKFGFDSILYLDCDMIVRKDIFSRLKWDLPDGIVFFTCDNLGTTGPIESSSPLGNVISKDSAKPLIEYCKSMKWVGTERPWCPGQIMGQDYPGYDAVFLRYVIANGLKSLHSDIPLVAHVGLVGLDCHEHELEKQLFAGHPETWLSNAVKIFNPDVSHAFVPRGWTYE